MISDGVQGPLPDADGEWFLVQERTIDGRWSTYAGPFGDRSEARTMMDAAVDRHGHSEFRLIRCSMEEGVNQLD